MAEDAGHADIYRISVDGIDIITDNGKQDIKDLNRGMLVDMPLMVWYWTAFLWDL